MAKRALEKARMSQKIAVREVSGDAGKLGIYGNAGKKWWKWQNLGNSGAFLESVPPLYHKSAHLSIGNLHKNKKFFLYFT